MTSRLAWRISKAIAIMLMLSSLVRSESARRTEVVAEQSQIRDERQAQQRNMMASVRRRKP